MPEEPSWLSTVPVQRPTELNKEPPLRRLARRVRRLLLRRPLQSHQGQALPRPAPPPFGRRRTRTCRAHAPRAQAPRALAAPAAPGRRRRQARRATSPPGGRRSRSAPGGAGSCPQDAGSAAPGRRHRARHNTSCAAVPARSTGEAPPLPSPQVHGLPAPCSGGGEVEGGLGGWCAAAGVGAARVASGGRRRGGRTSSPILAYCLFQLGKLKNQQITRGIKKA